jgi:FlaA1/EpsC-like NDP-sugar epimerase
MGEEMSIETFARRVVALRGLRVPDDVEIVFTGLRDGERAKERLIGAGEQGLPSPHPKVMDARANISAETDWETTIKELQACASEEERLSRRLLDAALQRTGVEDAAMNHARDGARR